MPGDYFWSCVEALSVALEGDPKTVESNIGIYVQHCVEFKPAKRAEVRRQLVQIIGGLAQIEAQLAEHDAIS